MSGVRHPEAVLDVRAQQREGRAVELVEEVQAERDPEDAVAAAAQDGPQRDRVVADARAAGRRR
jgi:hypothetical protein